MKTAKISLLFLLVLSALLFVSCGKDGYRVIDPENVIEKLTETHDCIVVDVRSTEAFMEGHVPDAVSIPLSTITDTEITALPEKGNTVIVYGATEGEGNQAARKIASLGYEKVLTFGAFDAWQGDIVTESNPAHVHLFNEKTTVAKFFVKDATKKEAAVFLYSCTCGERARYKTFTHGKTANERSDVGANAKEMLDGKKILFAGSSHNFYGKIVNNLSSDVTEQAARMGDTGYFYELCKQNGANVNVTNWSFGNHTLSDIFSVSCTVDKECEKGHDHLADLTDRNYDYVCFTDTTRANGISEEEYIEQLKSFMKLFTDVNPNCKFIFSISSAAYWYNHQDRLGAYDYVGFAEKIASLDGVTVVDPGRLIYDLIKRDALIPDSSVRCTESSLIVPDGQHPNLLSGYISAVMTYSAITGESAVGQPTKLENNTETGTALRFQKSVYVEKIYKGKSTNFVEIMDSENEMLGIQQMIDRYLDMETYRYYR